MRKTATRIGIFLLLGLALAAGRVIVIEYPDGTRSGDLRYGPWVYEAKKPGGIRGRVGNLMVLATRAVLKAPEGKTMAEATGERVAIFEGEVELHRGRVVARGPRLVYREATGVGVLFGPAEMEQKPAKKGEDPVFMKAKKQMAFDVDDDTSESDGAIELKSGNQEGYAEHVYYEEARTLAVFSSPGDRVKLIRRRKEGDLVILAEEARMLVREKKLLAKGRVELIDGDKVTRGEALFYDDNKKEAIVIGRPAVSQDKKNGRELRSGTLLHDVDKHRVRLFGKPFKLPEKDFLKKNERP